MKQEHKITLEEKEVKQALLNFIKKKSPEYTTIDTLKFINNNQIEEHKFSAIEMQLQNRNTTEEQYVIEQAANQMLEQHQWTAPLNLKNFPEQLYCKTNSEESIEHIVNETINSKDFQIFKLKQKKKSTLPHFAYIITITTLALLLTINVLNS